MNHRLPIYEIEEELVVALRAGGRAIVQAPTGSGKSTQIPQMLLDRGLCGNGRIVVLQPRRIAARLLARRVAAERGLEAGGEVGYQVRFENCSTPATRIKYETDGIILRELIGDPRLRQVAVIVFDEFHERHLYGDLMLGLALRLQQGARPDLKLLAMSATLDTARLEPLLAPCRTIRAAGRAFPVALRHLEPHSRLDKTPVWDLAAEETAAVLRDEPAGHVLVFMPGAYEIRRTIEAIRRLPAARECEVVPLHGELPPRDQDRAVAPSAQRRIIVATNVAETSLTIDGVTAVVDSGLARIARFDPRRGINTLLMEKISRAAADQRAGRAGRTRPGQCIRLWSEREQARRPAQEAPEIHRVDLAETLLQLKQAGIDNLDAFPWVDPPLPGAIERAEALLLDLGALDRDGRIRPLGARLVPFPLHPRISRMLLAAEAYGCVPSACRAAALMQERDILRRTSDHAVLQRRRELAGDRDESDFILLLRALDFAVSVDFDAGRCEPLGLHAGAARSVTALQAQLLKIARSQGLQADAAPQKWPRSARPEAGYGRRTADGIGHGLGPSPATEVHGPEAASDTTNWDGLFKSILTAFPDQVAARLGSSKDRCAVAHGRRGTIAADSIVGPYPLLVAAEIQEIGTGRGAVEVRLSALTAVREEWLRELFGNDLTLRRIAAYDGIGKRVTAEQRTVFRDLTIATERVTDVSDDEAAHALAAEVVAGRLTLKLWDAKVEQWLARVNLVARAWPELGVSPIDAAARNDLITQICHGLHGARDVKARDVWPVLRDWLSREQRLAVESLAPEKVSLTNGRQPKVCYDDPTGGPYIAMRVQELYDVKETPALCGGRIKLRVRILAPNQRPVQITDDLASFWRNGYEQVKKDLRGRYPKHEWR